MPLPESVTTSVTDLVVDATMFCINGSDLLASSKSILTRRVSLPASSTTQPPQLPTYITPPILHQFCRSMAQNVQGEIPFDIRVAIIVLHHVVG